MPKSKAFLKQAKPKPKKEQKLDTADDFQAAGVDFEEAAGKWRAGDAAKSMRFFQRAVDVYAQGLAKFPQSIDLAYNKARVQLEIATHPILTDQLQQPLKDVLEEALASHRYVLQLDPENADALFNTSQVITAIAEDMASSEDDEGNEAQALKILHEALDLQSRCLSVQEQKYQEFLEQERIVNEREEAMDTQSTAPSNSANDTPQGSAEEEDEWFNVVEPVTHDTLIDTVIAQLGTLTTFCSILSSSPKAAPAHTLSWVEELSASLLQKAQTFSADHPERLQEIALAKGNLVSMMLEAAYRSGRIDVESYKRERDAAFAVAELQLERSSDGLIANARSLLALNSALADAENGDAQSYSTLRWNVLTASIANLKSASAIQGISQEDLATTHLLRGDASLYLCAMAFPPTSHQTAKDTVAQNAKNAAVYYRNASRLSQDQEEKDVSSIKSAVAQYLETYSQGQGDLGLIFNASPRDQEWTAQQLEDMVAEKLVPQALLF
ncbi:Plasma membrane low glucose sensor [Hypoxylon texense]